MAAEPGAHQLGPAIALELARKKAALAAELFGLCIHVVHKFIDEGNGDLFNLRFGIGHFSDEDIAGGVDAAFGFGV
jgi:hypothetical protein